MNFIDKHYDEIIKHYFNEAEEMEFSSREIQQYVAEAVKYTWIGPKSELPNKNYIIFIEDDGIVAAESFDGTTYDFITYNRDFFDHIVFAKIPEDDYGCYMGRVIHSGIDKITLKIAETNDIYDLNRYDFENYIKTGLLTCI